MVFSQTSLKTQSVLKVVELDRLKPEKNQQENGLYGETTAEENGSTSSPSPMATTSFSEVYLKPEPTDESKMFHNSDSEFFQDLVQWCYGPAKEEQVLPIDSPKVTEERTPNTDTLHTPFSPQGWDALDANSPAAQAGYYVTTPNDPPSPLLDGFMQTDSKFPYYTDVETENKTHFQEQFLNISSLPLVIGDLASEIPVDSETWRGPEPIHWINSTYDTDNTNKTDTNTLDDIPFLDEEDSLDLKNLTTVQMRDVERNDVVIAEYVINNDLGNIQEEETRRDVVSRVTGLTVDVAARAPGWPADIISTPEVLSCVEQLEKEKCPLPSSKQLWTTDIGLESLDTCPVAVPLPVEYEPITPKSESHVESDIDDIKSHSNSRKRRHDSEDSDETYTPYTERTTTRKYRRRKSNIPLKEMIEVLEESQQAPKARRGRPPKRRESTISSACSVDENSSTVSTQEMKYRELRDKNNVASKRSRMNRKLKELQMEKLALDLEERNKKLQVRADVLEDMTKKLKDALMTAILKK